MAATFFNAAEPFEQIVYTISTEGPMWNLVKIAHVISEKKSFKNYKVLTMHIAQGQEQITPRGQNFDCNYKVLLFNHTLQISAISL